MPHALLGDVRFKLANLNSSVIDALELNWDRAAKATLDFQRWIDEINKATSEKLAPLLSANGMLLSQQKYLSAGLKTDSYNLSLIPDFNTLIAKSQKARTPVFALTKKQMERGGVILEKTIQNRDSFKKLFSDLADTILSLTGG